MRRRHYDPNRLLHFANCLREVLGLAPIPFTEPKPTNRSDAERFYIEPYAWKELGTRVAPIK